MQHHDGAGDSFGQEGLELPRGGGARQVGQCGEVVGEEEEQASELQMAIPVQAFQLPLHEWPAHMCDGVMNSVLASLA